jgi:predicted RNA-binding protein (virulence factor B family)
VAVFGELVFLQFFYKKKGIYHLICFFQNIFHQMEKFTTKKIPYIQVEELRKIKLKTTYPSFNGLFILLGLTKDVVFQILHLMVP